jgi:hypothetical protein
VTIRSIARKRDEFYSSKLPSFATTAGGGATVRRTPAEEIVAFVSFSSDHCDHLGAIEKLCSRQWKPALQWLDDAGLAFYFLQRLKQADATGRVPAWVSGRLQQNFAANQERVRDLSKRFGSINQRFNDAGIRYAVLKGLSLVPEFCPNADLRYQSDFDYLVDERDIAAAQRVVGEAGYIQKASRSSMESIFVLPDAGEGSRSGEQYLARAPHVVELHVNIWDVDLHRLPAIPRLFYPERAIHQEWKQLVFPALNDEDAFLLQVVHACKHVFTHWVRMASLLEIAYFLKRRASDALLWNRTEERVGESLVLREFVTLVAGLAARLFCAPVPPLIRRWSGEIRPAPRVWMEKYAQRWAFCELPVYQFSMFPKAKLVLFLHRQYRDDAATPKGLAKNHVLPFDRFIRIFSAVRKDRSLLFDPAWWRRQVLIRRTVFHVLAGFRYLCELPRWMWLNRARVRPAGASLDGVGSLDSGADLRHSKLNRS